MDLYQILGVSRNASDSQIKKVIELLTTSVDYVYIELGYTTANGYYFFIRISVVNIFLNGTKHVMCMS